MLKAFMTLVTGKGPKALTFKNTNVERRLAHLVFGGQLCLRGGYDQYLSARSCAFGENWLDQNVSRKFRTRNSD